MKLTASALQSTPSIAFHGWKESGHTQRKNSGIAKSSAGLTHIKTVSTVRISQDGDGRTDRNRSTAASRVAGGLARDRPLTRFLKLRGSPAKSGHEKDFA